MPRFPRLTLPLFALAAAVAVGVPGALGGSIYERKDQIDSRIAGLQGEIEQAKEEEGVLTTQISAATERIRGLEREIAPLNDKVARLERELSASQARLARLQERYRYQTQRLRLLVRDHEEAQRRLETRLVQLYETEQPDTLSIILTAQSFTDLIEQIELFNDIASQDKRIAEEIKVVKGEMREARAQTAVLRREVAAVTRQLSDRTAEQRAARDALLSRQNELVGARTDKSGLLASVRDERHQDEEDLEQMLATSAEIAARIQGVQSTATSGSVGSGSVSSAGFIWPVQGVLTSGFGWRWGRMHEGIDVAAPTGTAIHAAASGTVIYAGWLGGYGNLTIIDHGNGVATAYGHQSAIYVTAGSVSQGQAIGAVGSTGNSTGPHLHFEVRINGSAVDPLGYL